MKKGFTLIELLIVIGILAILATATILVLNPAQLFAQARDSQRISDLASLRSAISFYLSVVSSPNLGASGLDCATEFASSVAGAAKYSAPVRTIDAGHSAVRAVDGTGWVAINFTDTELGGSPLATLPSDPTNDGTNNYQYSCDNTARTFELDANMQSTRYRTAGPDDVETNTQDGGNDDAVYEVGTNLAL